MKIIIIKLIYQTHKITECRGILITQIVRAFENFKPNDDPEKDLRQKILDFYADKEMETT